MNDLQTWTTVWELTVEVEAMMGGAGESGRNSDNCNRTTLKKTLKINK